MLFHKLFIMRFILPIVLVVFTILESASALDVIPNIPIKVPQAIGSEHYFLGVIGKHDTSCQSALECLRSQC